MRFARGFYAILDRDDEQLARTLASHADVLQVRIKPGDAVDILRVARMARAVCDELGVLLFVNDRVDLALAAKADGVHLGQTDLPIAEARRLAPQLKLGISTHSLEHMQRAVSLAPDYIAYGPVFATRTKEDPDPVQGTEALARAVAVARAVPVVAIGGITPRDAASVFATGAAAICAIASVNDAGDVGAAARCLGRRGATLFATGE